MSQRLNLHSFKNIGIEQCSLLGNFSHFPVVGFQCHAIQNRSKSKSKSFNRLSLRIWEMKGGTYTKTLAKIQVRGIFRIRGIRRNVLPKLVERRHSFCYLHINGTVWIAIDLFTVYDAILAGEQTRLKLQ